MAAPAKKTAPSTFSWTDDEVELLLKVTNEYKISKTADNVDWESVQKKYSDILDRFKNELEKASGSSGKDYPHKREEITKQCLTNKLKSIRLKYRQAVDTGKRSGHGRVVLLYYELCESIWGGSPATQQLASGLESGDITATLEAHGDADIATTSSEGPADASGLEGDVSENDSLTESQSLSVKQRRNLLDNKLNNHKQEKLKRKLPKDGQLLEYAKEDIEMKKRLMNHIEKMEERYQDNMAKMSANMEKLSDSIGAGFSVLQGLLVPQHNLLAQQQMYGMLSFPTSANLHSQYSQHVSETPEISGRMSYPRHFSGRTYQETDENI